MGGYIGSICSATETQVADHTHSDMKRALQKPATASVCLLQCMHFKLPHADTVSAVTQQVKPLQQTQSFSELQVLILEVFIAFFEVANEMLLSG